jgi:hypothetical protein
VSSYQEHARRITAALGDPPPWGERTAKAAFALALLADYGAGDALAGWLLKDRLAVVHKNLTSAGLASGGPSLDGLLEALGTPTGEPRVDRVLAALDRAAAWGAGMGSFDEALKQIDEEKKHVPTESRTARRRA